MHRYVVRGEKDRERESERDGEIERERWRDKKVFWKLRYYVRDPSITHDANNTDKYTPT